MYILNIKYSWPDRKNFKMLVEIYLFCGLKRFFAKCMTVYPYAGVEKTKLDRFSQNSKQT